MQACRRGGDAAVVRRIDRLIAILIGLRGTAPDVGRQRNLAVLGERRARVERSDKTYAPKSAAQYLQNLDCAVIAQCDVSTRLQLPARVPHCEPGPILELSDHQELSDVSRVPFPVQSRWYDPRCVDDEQVAGRDQLRQVTKVELPSAAGRAVEHEQPARRAVGQGMLRDLRAGKIVVEVSETMH